MEQSSTQQPKSCQTGECFFRADEGSKYCKHHRSSMEAYDAKIAAAAEPALERTTPQNIQEIAARIHERYNVLNCRGYSTKEWVAALKATEQEIARAVAVPEPQLPTTTLSDYRADIDRHAEAKDFDKMWTTAESLFAALECFAVPEPAAQPKWNYDVCCKVSDPCETHAQFPQVGRAEPAAQQDGYTEGFDLEDIRALADGTPEERENNKYVLKTLRLASAYERLCARQAEPAPTPSRVKILEGVIRNFEGYQEMGRTVLYDQIETALKALGTKEGE